MNEMMMYQTNPAIVSAAETAKAKIQAAYTMAMHRPRNEFEVRDVVLALCKNPEFADESWFKIPNKGEGFTIRFAEAVGRAMKNIYSDSQVVYEDDKIMREKISLTDLESNITFSTDITVSKTVERKTNRPEDYIGERKNSKGETVYILKASSDEFEQRVKSAKSKAIRTELLRLIPPDIKAEAKRQIITTKKIGDASMDPKDAIRKLMDAFSGIGVSPEALQKYYGNQPLSSISPDQKEELRGLYVAIKEGHTTWGEVMSARALATERKDPEKIDVETIISAATPEVKYQALATLNLGGKEPGKDDPNMRNAYALKILEVQRAIPSQPQQVVVLDEKVRKQILAFLKDESVASMYLDACETLKVEPLGNIAAHRDPDLKAIYDFCKQRVSV